jgi:hypothetical protein
MNTLSRHYTSQFFTTQEHRLAFRRQWSQIVNSERRQHLKAVHHLTYLVLCGKDWRKAFTFPTNPNKLNNGYQPEIYRVLRQFNSAFSEKAILEVFEGKVSHDTLVEARKLIAFPQPASDNSGAYLTEAYCINSETKA